MDCLFEKGLAYELLGLASVSEFWDKVPDSEPRLQSAGAVLGSKKSRKKQKIVPLWVHADGVEYGERNSLMIWSFGSALVEPAPEASFYLASFVKSVTYSGGVFSTWKTIWQVLKWSFQALWDGVHPSSDWEGVPFPPGHPLAAKAGSAIGGYKFVIWNVLGDLEMFCNHLGLPHWNKLNLCWHCDAHKKDASKYYGHNWKGHGWELYDAAEYAVALDHALFSLPGVSSWSVCFDVLHCLDCHGVASHLLGAALHQLVYQFVAGKSAAFARIGHIWKRIQELYQQEHTKYRLPNLTLNMICNPDKPRQGCSLTAKAAEVRHLAPIICLLLDEGVEDEFWLHMKGAVQALATFYSLLEGEPMFMSAEASQATLTCMETCLEHYAWLREACEGQGFIACQEKPKCHFSWHLAYLSRFQNPRYN